MLTSYTKGTTTAGYTYNGNSLRMSATTGGSTHTYTWNTVNSLPLLLDDAVTTFIYGPTGPIEQIADTGGAVSYLQSDQHGSTRLITDPTGTTTGTYKYDAYGNPTHTGTATTQLTYSGQYTDPTTGYQYLRARDYDPSTGQFTSVDPLLDSTHTPYAYVDNDSTNKVDPGGEDWRDIATAVTGTFDGLTGGLTKDVRQGLGIDDSAMYSTAVYKQSHTGGEITGVVAGAINPEEDAAEIAQATDKGIIYLRQDSTGTLKDYVGQSKNEDTFAARQRAHANNHPNSTFTYTKLETGAPESRLDVWEETHIRKRGGPTNRSNPAGGLSNKRHQMSETRYRKRGGTYDF